MLNNLMLTRTQKGFTLIELLVVIAIIGVLSSVVLTSLNSARAKANNTKVKAQLSMARSQAEVYYDSQIPPGYTASVMAAPAASCTGNMFDGAFTNNLESTTGTAGAWPNNTTLSCQASGQTYAISASLPSPEGANNVWCVDSGGRSMGLTTHLTSGDYSCL